MEILQKFLCVFSFVVTLNMQSRCSDDNSSGLTLRRVRNTICWKLLHTPSHEVLLWVNELNNKHQQSTDKIEKGVIDGLMLRALAHKNIDIEQEKQKLAESLDHN